jgi:hypothetical protein
MRPVGADDEVYRQVGSVGQCGFDAVAILAEFCYARVEAVIGLILGRLIQHVDQVATQDLELGDDAVAVECRHRHLGPATSIGFDPRQAALIERACLHLGEQPHPPDHVTACTPQIDGLSAWADAVGELNERYPIPTLVQPESQCGPCDPGSADQYGRLWHG